MRISIIGYSASGKSTFAKTIGEILNIPVLHLDKVNFLPNWVERKKEESKKIENPFEDRRKKSKTDEPTLNRPFEEVKEVQPKE